MQKLETMLDEWLVKKAPFQLPEGGKKGLVSALPWLTLIGGVLELFAAWGLWVVASWANSVNSYLNDVNAAYGLSPTLAAWMPAVWVSLILVLVEAIMFFVAFGPLRNHSKKGWNILFWVSLLNIVYAVVNMFVYQNFFSLIMSLIGSLVGLYLLFQVRSYYMGGASKSAAAAPAAKK